MIANVLVTTKAGMLDRAVEDISKISEARIIKRLLGRYDVIAVVDAEDIERLGEIVLEINRSPAVLSTDTLISFKFWGELGRDFAAVILIRLTEPEEGEKTAEDILKLEGVKAVALVFGSADAIAFISDSDTRAITRLAKQVHSIRGVFRTETLVVF